MTSNIGSKSGPKPGNAHAIPQDNAIAMGFVGPASPSRVNINQPRTTTGKTHVPGLTRRGT